VNGALDEFLPVMDVPETIIPPDNFANETLPGVEPASAKVP
jgi:hypothetical protein